MRQVDLGHERRLVWLHHRTSHILLHPRCYRRRETVTLNPRHLGPTTIRSCCKDRWSEWCSGAVVYELDASIPVASSLDLRRLMVGVESFGKERGIKTMQCHIHRCGVNFTRQTWHHHTRARQAWTWTTCHSKDHRHSTVDYHMQQSTCQTRIPVIEWPMVHWLHTWVLWS